MSSLINSLTTNTTALSIRNNLYRSNNNLSKTLERLSSGVKINYAKDGAAECIISSKTNTKLSGLNIASNNTSHGINLLDIADSSLENMLDKTLRIRNLVLQAMNETYSNEELKALQDEINELNAEIIREKETTKYNKKDIFVEPSETGGPTKPYKYKVEYLESTGTQWINTNFTPSGDFSVETTMQATAGQGNRNLFGASSASSGNPADEFFSLNIYNDNLLEYKTYANAAAGWQTVTLPEMCDKNLYEMSKDGISVNGQKIVDFPGGKSNVSNPVLIFRRSTSGGAIGKGKVYDFKIRNEAGELIRDMIPVVDFDGNAALYDNITGQMFYNQGSGSFVVGDKIEDSEEKEINKDATFFQIGSEAGNNNTIDLDLSFELNDLSIDISDKNSLYQSLSNCDILTQKLLNKRSMIDCAANRFDSILQLQNNSKINLNILNSSLVDADMAQEATNLVRNQIFQKTSASLFSQAQGINGNLALRLLGIQNF